MVEPSTATVCTPPSKRTLLIAGCAPATRRIVARRLVAFATFPDPRFLHSPGARWLHLSSAVDPDARSTFCCRKTILLTSPNRLTAGNGAPDRCGDGHVSGRRLLDRTACAHRTRPHRARALGTTRRSYAELAERIGRLASGLRELGVVHGDRVGWLGENHPAFLETLFAAAKLGAVFAPVNHRLRADAVAGILDDYAVKLVIVADAAVPLDLPASVHAIPVDGGTSAGTYQDLITSARVMRADALVEPDDVCIMPHTSGTTGSPKGVKLTHANVTWNAINMLSVADMRSDDVTLALAPLFRTGGMGVNVLPVLFKGGTVVVRGRADSRRRARCDRA